MKDSPNWQSWYTLVVSYPPLVRLWISQVGERYAILPSISFNGNRTKEEYIKHYGAKPVKEGFHYSSDTNDTWETVESIKEKIARYVDTEHII